MFSSQKLIFFAYITVTLNLNFGYCIKCYTCNSKTENLCSDPFLSDSNNDTRLAAVDCSIEVSTREFASYLSNLMSVLGFSANGDTKYALNKIRKEDGESFVCQKTEVNDGEHTVIIRDCAILSDIVCEPLKNNNPELSISFCDICTTDYCNNSIGLQYFRNLTVLIVVVLTNVIII